MANARDDVPHIPASPEALFRHLNESVAASGITSPEGTAYGR